ncbi:hypothetical protein QTH90_10195 [Variovorax sp. J2P1-59]|uniref:esterase/lipase family protein n=1 Tax=Variovorax flavidus TaxID=3053501 RepID=UPI0025767A5E|nr:hypothetical protein [Variovorax sp. J2P1-59]MDM0074753.1 hypothetical protein [Variovorax sp. J2P1-59]
MPEAKSTAPEPLKFPVIYVRGFAFTADERDQTAADPYCGFNVGSTVYRATADKERPKSYFFESPLVRLSSEFGYHVLYKDGMEIVDPAYASGEAGKKRLEEGIPIASIIIHRFYDAASRLRGTGQTSSIEDYAKELSSLIAMVRELVRPTARAAAKANGQSPTDDQLDAEFRCYLVAHSMGGLVVRTLMQNDRNDVPELEIDDVKKRYPKVRGCVAKVFTYGTPHNGIDIAGFNVPAWPGFLKDVGTFNRDTMRAYLDQVPVGGNVNYLPADVIPPPSHWFSMIGTNRMDYEVAKGMSRTFVGRGSDGLVRIDNATLWHQREEGGKTIEAPVACAYAYRSHSGNFGIVNSEEAYQNLVRFLFGNFRVDLWLDIEGVTLPDGVQAEEDKGRKVDAVYQIELVVSTHGKTWSLSRRKAEEDSPACRTYQGLKAKAPAVDPVHLSTVFMMKAAKVKADNPGISYSVTIGIRAPDYEVAKAFWPDGHFEGVSLFRDSLIVTLFDPNDLQQLDPNHAPTVDWMVRYSWAEHGGVVDKRFTPVDIRQPIVVEVPLPAAIPTVVARNGAVTAKLRMEARAWQ